MDSSGNHPIQTDKFFVVAAGRNGNEFLRSHHIDRKSAEIALKMTIDTDRLIVVAAEIEFAANGNVRIWRMLPN